MARLPGKKFRTEHFHVDGMPVSVEVRISDEGAFYAQPDGLEHFSALSLAELRAKLKPYLEKTRRLEFDPFIDVEYNEADETSRYDNLKENENRQEVVLEFSAGWLSRGSVAENKRRWISVYVDPKTNQIDPLTQHDRQHDYSQRSSKALIPFTPERWSRLRAIAEALAVVRARVAEVLEDATGAKLESLVLPKLLGEAPATKKGAKR